jgi:hypothetical protein
MNRTAILAAAYRYGAHRGALDAQRAPAWLLLESLPLTRAAVASIIARGDPRCRGLRRWLARRRLGTQIQAEVDLGYQAGRAAELARRDVRASIRLLPGSMLHIVRGSEASTFRQPGA